MCKPAIYSRTLNHLILSERHIFMVLCKVADYHSDTAWLYFPFPSRLLPLNSEAQVECGNGTMGNDVRHLITHISTSPELIRDRFKESLHLFLSKWESSHWGWVSDHQDRMKVAPATASSGIHYCPLQRPSMPQTGSLPPRWRNILSSSLQLITAPPSIISRCCLAIRRRLCLTLTSAVQLFLIICSLCSSKYVSKFGGVLTIGDFAE